MHGALEQFHGLSAFPFPKCMHGQSHDFELSPGSGSFIVPFGPSIPLPVAFSAFTFSVATLPAATFSIAFSAFTFLVATLPVAFSARPVTLPFALFTRSVAPRIAVSGKDSCKPTDGRRLLFMAELMPQMRSNSKNLGKLPLAWSAPSNFHGFLIAPAR